MDPDEFALVDKKDKNTQEWNQNPTNQENKYIKHV